MGAKIGTLMWFELFLLFALFTLGLFKGGSYYHDVKVMYTTCGTGSHHPFYEGKTYLIMGKALIDIKPLFYQGLFKCKDNFINH